MSVCEQDDPVALRNEAIKKIEEEIDSLPDLRKSAYLEAVKKVPHLVETESPPIRFLRYTGYENPREAADLLCCYWDSRKVIFVERAFLPMNQTGNGALDKEDVRHLDVGSFAFLPNSVLFHDPSKYAETSEQSKLRLSFYLWSIVSENKHSQRDGCAVVVPLSSSRSGANFKVFEDVVFRAMPLRIKHAYLLCCPNRAEVRIFYANFLPKVVREMVNLLGRKETIHVTVADNLGDFANVLATNSLQRSGLPEVLGGTWNFLESFLRWRRERLVLERGRDNKNVPFEAGFPHNEQGTAAQQAKAGNILYSWEKLKSVPASAKYRSASFTSEQQCLDESVHSDIHFPKKNPLSQPSHLSTSKPASANHLGNTREDNTDTFNKSPAMLDQRRREFEEALLEIPREERQAYSEALEQSPHLVATEPGPLSFLRAVDFDAIAAARRMVSFWALRKSIFGDRAFLPMDQTGDGALSREDLELMGIGFMMHAGLDSQGRSIVVVQGSLLHGCKYHLTMEKVNRCAFYLAYVASEATLKHGVVCVRVIDPLAYKARGKGLGRLLSTCSGPFICHSVVQGQVGTGFIDSIAAANEFGEDVTNHYIHAGECVELAAKLRSHGILEESLPPSLGGPWTVEKFKCWCRDRVAIERKQGNDVYYVSKRLAHAHPKERKADREQTGGVIREDILKEPSTRAALAKTIAGSRRRTRETAEDTPFPRYDTKKGRRSLENGA